MFKCLPNGAEDLVGAEVVALRWLASFSTRNNALGLRESRGEVRHAGSARGLIARGLGGLVPEKLGVLPHEIPSKNH